jgi:plastocyanin
MRRFNHIRYGKILAMMFVLVSYTAVTTSVYLYSQFGNELGLNHVLQFTSAKPAKIDDPKVAIIDIRIGSARAGGSVPLSPSIINIHKGDTVMWVNNDNVTHSLKALSFTSNVIWPQGHRPSTFNYTFNDAGTFVYVDSLHPYLGGVIYVDIPTTQREIISTTASFVNVKIEMPQNAAYKNNYGGFFIPASIQAPVGTKLTWSNKDYVAHTATSSDGSAFDTRTILPGTSLTLTIHHKGVFPYYCKIHPWMMGTVIVS